MQPYLQTPATSDKNKAAPQTALLVLGGAAQALGLVPATAQTQLRLQPVPSCSEPNRGAAVRHQLYRRRGDVPR